MSDLLSSDGSPEGWITIPFLQVVDYEGGSQPPKKEFAYQPRSGYVRLLQIRDFGESPFPTYVPDTTRLKKAGTDDLLVARYGGGAGDDCLGRICTGLSGAYNVALVKLRFPKHFVLPGFVKAYFQGPWFKAGISVNSRSCQQGFNRKDLESLSFQLPPLAEQQRIVGKVEALLARVNAARRRLAKVPAILKRFRQSVLAAAFADYQAVPLGSVITELRYGTATRCDYKPEGTPVLRIPNIGNGVVDQSDLKYGKLGDDERRTLSLRAGDVLVIRSNGSVSLVGKPALVSDKEHGFAFAGYLMRIRLDQARALPDYLCRVLESPGLREQIEMPARSTSGVHNINTSEVKALVVPLPPLAEQHEIVRRIEALFRLADAIEKRMAAATARAEKLTQAILAKAFRGELVPTEAELARREGRDYEPASALLDRILAERAADPAPQKRPVRRGKT
jgi:type I restriction enzyme S subunit